MIPHITRTSSKGNISMQRTLFLIEKKDKGITFVPPHMECCREKEDDQPDDVFVGARRRFSPFALSSSMPTLSFSFSTKAQGINRSIFGHADCFLGPKYLDAVASADHMSPMLNETAAIWLDLAERIPKVQREAQNAGIVIRQPLGEIE